jgi:hypothetical protein
MQMKKFIVLGIAAILTGISLISLAGCIDYNRVVGSKNIETRQFDYSGFKRIEVSYAFKVDVTRSDTYSVSVTMNDNIFNDLDISITGDTLRIGMKSFKHFVSTTQHAAISLPELDALVITGACQAVVSGFQSDGNLDLEVNGASSMEINDLKTADANIKVLGFSHLSGSLITNNCDFEVTGASNIKLTGSAYKMQLNVIGASHAALTDFIVEDASVMAEGASTAEVEVHGTLDVDISGVSTLVYGDSPKLGRVEVSGISTLSRR